MNDRKTSPIETDSDFVTESDSFWEPGNYKHTTKRIADAYSLSNDLVQLIQERYDERMFLRKLIAYLK